MKNFFTFLCLLAFIGSSNAQGVAITEHPKGVRVPMLGNRPAKQPSQVTRAANHAFTISYDAFDAVEAAKLGTQTVFDQYEYINHNYPQDSFFTYRWAAVNFDTLVETNAAAGTSKFYPRALTQLTLDSLDVAFTHVNVSHNPDTITITVYDRDSFAFVPGIQYKDTLVYNKRWDTVIIVSASIATNGQLSLGGGTTVNYTDLTFYPNLSFATGKTFGVRVDFGGAVTDKFALLNSYRNDCGTCWYGGYSSSLSAAGFTSFDYVNLKSVANGFNYSGVFETPTQIYLSCDTTAGVTHPNNCDLFSVQDWWIFPSVTANVQYGVTVVADSLFACPGTQINLAPNVVGSNSTPFTYSWQSNHGSFSSNTDSATSFTVADTNATITLTVIDAANDTTTTTLTIASHGINVKINNTNPLTLNCGSTATLTTSSSGYTAGTKTFTWSNGVWDSTLASTYKVRQPGTYSVTVVNSAGCSAESSISVVYPNNISNTANFTLPAFGCVGKPVQFNNTSADTTGWSSNWDFCVGGTCGGTSGTTNPIYIYSGPGVYKIALTLDSGACSVTSATKTLTVYSAQSAQCPAAIEDVTFDNAISVLPNPTNGVVNVVIAGVQSALSIKIYNILGAEVANYQNTDAPATFNKSFDLSGFASGTYLIKIQSGNSIAVKRLIVSK